MSAIRRFWKYEALGNDYLVVDPRRGAGCNAELARALCDRNRGPGGDGVLEGPFAGEGFRFTIWNPDGSTAEKSGNGIRIFARYLRDAGYASDRFVTVSPQAGPVACEYLDRSGSTIRAEMGIPEFASARIPVLTSQPEALALELQVGARPLTVHCVSMGNPHAVFLVPRLDRQALLELGPLLETHALFPNRSNVQMACVGSRESLALEIWERGAGYTLASGTSSCAATAVCQRLGLLDERVTVSMPGGQVLVERRGDTLHLTGSVCPVFEGTLQPAWLKARGIS